MTNNALRITTLTNRADFLRVQAAPRVGTKTLVLHHLPNPTLPEGTARVGFTVTKRCGGAVERNRIKRRLRVLARTLLAEKGASHTDYVLVGKPGTGDLPFDALKRDMEYAIRKTLAKETP